MDATRRGGTRDPGDVADDDRRTVELDVTEEREVEAAMARVADEAGGLHILVNNAAVAGPAGRLGDLSPASVEATVRVNLLGPMLVTRAALPTLRDGARVVNVSSGSGQFAGGISSAHLPYGVSKAGPNAFTDSLAAQYDDLIVNAAPPGWVRTEMGGPNASRSVERGAETPVWLARFRHGPSGGFWRDKRRIER